MNTTTSKTKPRTIRDADIARVKAKVDLAALIVAAEGIELTPAGAGQLKGLCPFHDENTPSFMVNPARGVYFCHGCGAGGDAIAFVMAKRHLSFAEAVEFLAGRVGTKLRRAKVHRHTYSVGGLRVEFADGISQREALHLLLSLMQQITAAGEVPCTSAGCVNEAPF